MIRAALELLHTATEPTIEAYDVEAPDEAGPQQWACPVNLATESTGSLGDRLAAEVARLRPWSAETRRARGRTLFGASGADPDQVDEVAAALVTIAETGDVLVPPASEVDWAFSMPLLIRHLADDLRTFYHEAVAAQPGPGAPNHDALNDWIFGGTALGDTLTAIADHLTEVEDQPMTKLVRGFLIPEGRFRGGSAFPTDRSGQQPAARGTEAQTATDPKAS
ncbi:MAG: hypothetical protein OEV40_06985 [Acidimicrobiia bacterium]|nr:hypothetical protein [Acidimicrobiia bacterium]